MLKETTKFNLIYVITPNTNYQKYKDNRLNQEALIPQIILNQALKELNNGPTI